MTDETTAEMPVEAPVPVTTETSEVTPPAVETPNDAGEEAIEDKPRGGFQRRIKELADDRNHWRELALRNATPAPVEAPIAAAPVKMPTLEDHGYDEAKYQAAMIEFVDRRAEERVDRRLSEVEQKRAEQTRVETFATRQQEFAKVNPDFEDRVLRDPTLPITTAMRDVIIDSPSGPEIAYYLATNREQAEQIARLPAHLAALEMGRIEGRISAIKEVKVRPPAVTKAPPPPPQIEASDAQVEKDPAQMTDKEFAKWRSRQIAQRR
jgi:hypothetical protein